MLLQTIKALFRKYRLFCYQKLFSAVREKPGDNFPVCRYHRDLSAKCNL